MIRKFFLVDDDEDDASLFNEALKDIDPSIEFDSANSGKELLDKLRAGKVAPHVIFLDINMPGMNGWETLENLKASNTLKDIPVIMYSTSLSVSDGQKALEKGALAFYEKPSNFLGLMDFLRIISASSPTTLKSTLGNMGSSRQHKVHS